MAAVAVILLGPLALLCVQVAGEKEWCDLKCGKNQNTMCEYEEKTFTDDCKALMNSFTAERRLDLLKQHNEYRNNLAGGKLANWPAAADMRLLTWDGDIEKSAQRWASQCPKGHDKCRRTPNFEAVGQNLLWSAASNGAPEVTISQWTDEADEASPDIVAKYQFDSRTGHFTQVIWASTYKLGCGEITYRKDGFNWALLACNYGPAGNFISRPMYTAGEPCKACPEGTQCFPESIYPFLCASQEEINSLAK